MSVEKWRGENGGRREEDGGKRRADGARCTVGGGSTYIRRLV